MAYLSMNDVLDELILQEKNVFTLGDAARIMHKDNGYVSKMLASNRKVVRIERRHALLTLSNPAPPVRNTFPLLNATFASFRRRS